MYLARAYSSFQLEAKGFNDPAARFRGRSTPHRTHKRHRHPFDDPTRLGPARSRLCARPATRLPPASGRRTPTYALSDQQQLQLRSLPTMEAPARRNKAVGAVTADDEGTGPQSTCFVKKLFTMVAMEDPSILSFSAGELLAWVWWPNRRTARLLSA